MSSGKNHFAQKIFSKRLVIFMHTNGFKLCNTSARMLHLYEFAEVVIFIKNVCIAVYSQLTLGTQLHDLPAWGGNVQAS